MCIRDRDKPRLVECADKILSGLEVDAHFSPDRTIDLREQRRRRLHKGNAAQVSRGDESRQVANNPAAQGDDKRRALQPMPGELAVTTLDRLQTLGSFARWNGEQNSIEPRALERSDCGLAITPRDMSVGNNGATPAQLQAAAMSAQLRKNSLPDKNGITPLA